MRINFLGAAETVTGSKYLLECGSQKILVDCGLFQGRKELRLKNWQEFPVNPASISHVLLTHAHIDHTGYLPLLVKKGFHGEVYCTEATKELCKILLPDSGYLQEEFAAHANKYGFSKHKPAKPLYTEKDAQKSLEYLRAREFGKKYQLFNDCDYQFNRAGHILGAASIVINHADTTIAFSGDLGRLDDPIMNPPVPIQKADYLVIEATYGNRLHKEIAVITQIEEVVNRTIERGGTIVIPAFAVGRAQLILYYLHELKEQRRIPDVPVYLDSPMAIDVTDLFARFAHEHKLTPAQAKAVCKTAHYVTSVEESKKIDTIIEPKIIISASGMASGGRVLHHIRVFAGDARNTFLFTGYQADGTRGDSLVNKGLRDIKMFGEYIHVNAEIAQLDNISAHLDYAEEIEWLKNFTTPPRKVFIVHGEHDSAQALKEKLIDNFGWDCVIPSLGQVEELV